MNLREVDCYHDLNQVTHIPPHGEPCVSLPIVYILWEFFPSLHPTFLSSRANSTIDPLEIRILRESSNTIIQRRYRSLVNKRYSHARVFFSFLDWNSRSDITDSEQRKEFCHVGPSAYLRCDLTQRHTSDSATRGIVFNTRRRRNP